MAGFPLARAAFWREPLLHFLVAGTALFVLYGALNRDETAPREIVVTPMRVQALQENFARTWLRPPTADETGQLIQDYIREEVYYREAIAMGLDRDDTVVRRRLQQKMEFFSEDVAALATPTEADLASFFESHRERFVEPARVSFEQVYFSEDQRGASARRDAEQALAALQSGRAADVEAAHGDTSLLPPVMTEATPQDVANAFGGDFATQLDAAPLEQWSGPLQSAYGLHLVRVTARVADTTPSLETVRPLVLREWQAEQTRRLGDEFYRSLLAKYEVRIETAGATP
jgi:hypothetical protein